MELVNVALWVLGIALIAVGYVRAKGPWARYQGLKSQQDNVARYEAWRGGVRDGGTSGATVMMEMARREARLWGAVAIVGFVLVFAGFLLR
ncbi:MAG TPA: hypothetical protein VLA44_05670 [Clostridia bacterium]|nr:hypothetical protein [Clostridia bacterium]